MAVRGLVAVVVLICAAAVSSAPAGATIYPQRSIAGVRLGMTKLQVRALLGKPGAVKRGRTPASGRKVHGKLILGYYTEYRWPGLRVVFGNDRKVTSISTNRRSERTPRGVGVGTTKNELTAKVAGLRCRTLLGSNYCYLGTLKRGAKLTLFYLTGQRVSRIEVGISFAK